MIDEKETIFRIDQVSDLERIIKDNDIKLIIIDPIQSYLPLNKSMDKANEVRDSLSPLIRLAEENKCSIILICHMNKNTKSTDIYGALGSIDFVGACRSMLLIKKDKGNVILEQTKNSLSKTGKPLKIVINEDGLFLKGDAY